MEDWQCQISSLVKYHRNENKTHKEDHSHSVSATKTQNNWFHNRGGKKKFEKGMYVVLLLKHCVQKV